MTKDESTITETDIQSAVEIVAGGKKNVILDSQLLTTLMSCPRLADFRFNCNFISIGGKSNSLECGSIAHKVLEIYHKNLINGLSKQQSIEHGMAAGMMYITGCKYCSGFTPSTEQRKPECGHQIDEYPGVRNTPPESTTTPSRTGWKWVMETMEQYFNFYKNDHWVPLEAEVVKGEVLYEDDEIRIMWKAKFDLISDTNQGIFPIDTKTMKQRRDTVSMNNQFIGQCILMKTRKVFINKVGWQTSLKPEEKFIRPPVNYSAPRLIEWQSTILPYYGKLLLMYAETGYFPPNFTNCEGKYGNCAFLKVCESDPSMREEEIKQNFVVGTPWDITVED